MSSRHNNNAKTKENEIMTSHGKQEIAELKIQLEATDLYIVTEISDNITTCVLITAIINYQKIKQIGVSIKGSNDKANDKLGYEIAYGRAIKKMVIRILNDKDRWEIK